MRAVTVSAIGACSGGFLGLATGSIVVAAFGTLFGGLIALSMTNEPQHEYGPQQ